jgi:putative RecB family exonuclease
MLRRWSTWRLNSGWEIARIGDQWAVELSFDVEIGGVTVRGYIDRVFQRGDDIAVVDLKSGRLPDDYGQLATYRRGLREVFGCDPQWGAFWLAREGGTGQFHDLRAYGEERLDYEYRMARQQQLGVDFRPKVSMGCGSWCSMRDFCPAVGGALAATVPMPWDENITTALADPSA